MLKYGFTAAALVLALSTPMVSQAQDKPAKSAEGEKAAEVKKPKLPESDDKARDLLKAAYDKMYSAKGKGMSKLYGEITIKGEHNINMGGQAQKMTDEVNYKFVWDGENDVMSKDVTEKEAGGFGAQMRQGLKGDADMIVRLIQMLVSNDNFEQEFPKGDSSFKLGMVSEEEAEAKLQRIYVTVRELADPKEEDPSKQEWLLKEKIYELTDGLLSQMPGDNGMKINFTTQKKGRDYFFETVKFDVPMGQMKIGKEYKVETIKKAGKYRMPTKFSVATDVGQWGKGTATIELDNFKVDKKVTQKLIDSVTKKEEKKEEKSATKDEVKGKDDKKKDDAKGDESPIPGVSKAQYKQIKDMIKARNGGKEPSDEEVKKAIEDFRKMRGNRGGRRGR